MGGNTFSKEHDSPHQKKPPTGDGVSNKSAKEPRSEEKSEKPVTTATTTPGSHRLEKPRSKDGKDTTSKSGSGKHGGKKSSADKDKYSKDKSKEKDQDQDERKDIFARIAAGRASTDTRRALRPFARRLSWRSNSSSHSSQQGDQQTKTHKPRKSVEERDRARRERGERQTSSMVIRMPVSTKSIEGRGGGKSAKQPNSGSGKYEKSHSEKQQQQLQKKGKSNKTSIVSKEGKSQLSSSAGSGGNKTDPKNKGHIKSKQSKQSNGSGGSNKSKTYATNLEANISAKPQPKPSSKDA
ncbi:hypothetical protein TYRP_008855 [Tyrophagus putrescentiae]|nr:hypothetical protein TYRP_008855 [Tyrophagus putrescentiae]